MISPFVNGSRLVTVSLALSVALATTAGATIPSGGVIHGCFNSRTGQLRVIDVDKGASCLASETALDWSQNGQSVEAWSDANDFAPSVARNTATNVSDWTLTTLVAVALPAGKFVVTAKTALLDQNENSTVYCALSDSAGVIDWSWDSSFDDEPATLAFEAAVTLSSPDTVALKCGSTGATTSADQSKIAAVKVGALH